MVHFREKPAASDEFILFHSVLWVVVPASVSVREGSSVPFKAPGMGGGGFVYKDAGNKQKIGREEGLQTHHPCTLSWGKFILTWWCNKNTICH